MMIKGKELQIKTFLRTVTPTVTGMSKGHAGFPKEVNPTSLCFPSVSTMHFQTRR